VARKSQPADAGVVGAPRDAGGTSLLARAIALLARREHSRTELARKLMRRLEEGQDRSHVDAVLDELQRRKLLSDERFAASLVRTRAPRYGAARLKLDLKARGVPAAIAAEALSQLSDGDGASEFDRARAIWSRRFGAAPQSLAERARQARFLESRGFSSEVIRKVLRGLAADDDA
jgi:regulatory protein